MHELIDVDVIGAASGVLDGGSLVTAFSDQGQNLAGTFFQLSLFPYLLFLYFLSYPSNSTPNLGNFGFQYLLLFVLATIPSGIVSKSVYGETLANVDWLHGGAEGLLTLTSILVVAGFRDKSVSGGMGVSGRETAIKAFALLGAVTFGVFCFGGSSLGFQSHSPFLFGLGDLPNDLLSTPNPEPLNALSIPTWAIHFSSVFEWLFAMQVIWNFAEVTNNEKWKGMTWGMLPLHASGIAACTYHFFYNDSSLQWMVSTQAGLTLLGNITCMIA
eukprot:CAMPEP_0118670002 /NCGR_PEP_ID=MMETSP0785-20121206/21208_1 /TAXON_ID=91992 /ORGANISM="Bolidomonas pacifica, Strain CCMP 1866" /LENGTH=271 /DNA_ID=CAMNT_0006564735 /DNA_START=571 /DNA_END=1383 /DNA_ORIENTATION=-